MATRLGLKERSDELWAYNKATALTGGLLSLLDSQLPGIREDVAEMLKNMVMGWGGPAFWASLQTLVHHLNTVSSFPVPKVHLQFAICSLDLNIGVCGRQMQILQLS